MKCTNCNSDLQPEAKFCTSCGKKNVADSQPATNVAPKKKSASTSVFSVIIFVIAISAGRYLTKEALSPSAAELARQGVAEMKTTMTLPSKVDDVTTITDVTAEGDTIHYHYSLAGEDSGELTDDFVRNYLGAGVCENTDTRSLLDEGINLRYSYTMQSTFRTVTTLFTKKDCL